VADNYFAKKRREREAAQGRTQLTPPNPLLPAQTTKAQNEAAASVYDPAQSAANVRKTNAETARTEALTPHEVRRLKAEAAEAERKAAAAGGWGAVDAEYAKDFVQWRANGGYADFRKQLEQLNATLSVLDGPKAKDNITGPIVGHTPDFVSAFVNQGAIDSRENVEEVIQRSLRAILGAQFTKDEGERLIARSYNPRLDEATNAKRVRRVMEHLDAMARAKEAAAAHFEQHGTLRGYRGPSYNLGDFDPTRETAVRDEEGNPDYSGLQGGGQMAAVDPGAPARREPHGEASAFLSELITAQVPYREALGRMRKRFPDVPAIPPLQYNEALQWRRKNPGSKANQGLVEKIIPMSQREQSNNSFAQSAPGAFTGRALNAFFAGAPALMAGDQGDFWRATTSAQHPTASLLGDFTGAVGGSLGAGGLLGKAGVFANSPGKRFLLGDSLYGGTFGATQNPDNPIGGAALGVGASLGGNALGRYTIGPGIRALAETGPGRAVGNAGSRFFGGGGFNPPQAPTPGQSLLMGQTGKVGIDDVRASLSEAADLNMPYSLADTDPRLRALAGSVTRKGPNAGALAENTFGPRQLGQAERALGAIDQHLAPTGDINQMTAAATQRARTASAPFYEKAKAAPAPYLTANPELAEILSRPTSEVALRRAYSTALDEGANPAELSITMGMDGRPILSGNPTWQTLHYVRRALDDEINSAIDPVTNKVRPGMSNAHGAMMRLRQDLDAQIGKLNPDFKAADAEYARFAQQGSAINRGAAMLPPRVTPETVQGVLSDLPTENLPLFRQGYASSLADTVENAQLSGNPYSRIYGTPAQQSKIGSIFPGADRFGRISLLEGNMAKTARETLGGSPTAARMEADKLFEGGNMAGDAAELGFGALTGTPPLGIARRIGGNKIGDMLRLGVGKSGARKADEIAPLLFNTDPRQAMSLLDELQLMKAQRDAFNLRFRQLGGAIGGPLATGAILPRQ
jgi:hypothetical protein